MLAEKRWLRAVAVAGVAIAAVVPLVVSAIVAVALEIEMESGAWGVGAAGMMFGVVGAVILAKVPENRLGWVFGGVSVAIVLSGFQSFARPLVDAGVSVSLVAVGQVIADASFTTMLFFVLVLTPSWFPTGRPLSRRWGWPNIPATAAAGSIVVMALFSSETKLLWDLTLQDPWRTVKNPIGWQAIPDFEESALAGIAILVVLAAACLAVASLVVRYRRSGPMDRVQIRSLVVAFLFLIPVIIVAAALGDGSSGLVSVAFELLFALAVLGVPVAAGVSILKFRLYDIDVIISKAVTYGVLAVFITAVYALVVVSVGSLFGAGDDPNLALSIVAVAIVAVVFEPLRNRVQHWANVLVYGKRATPYEVLAAATERLSESSDPELALREVTRLVAEGTGSKSVVLWLAVAGQLHPRSSTPLDALDGAVAVSISDGLRGAVQADRVVPVRHRGEVLGALSLSKERGESVTRIDERVLEDVAAGAGVLLRNIRLNAELAERAEQLRVSRRRLVAAHDAERRRLERDLHDGAQQQVVALKVKLGIARTLAEREGAGSVAELVGSVSDTTQEAVDGMRAVAHGIYPPLLEAEGLEAALVAARRQILIPVEISVEGIGRYDRSIEESLYFAVFGILSEAHDQGATTARTNLRGDDRLVGFSVLHDGAAGDLTPVRDRIDAFGGVLTVSGDPGAVVVSGHVPTDVTSLESA